jgi:hypothetical protein
MMVLLLLRLLLLLLLLPLPLQVPPTKKATRPRFLKLIASATLKQYIARNACVWCLSRHMPGVPVCERVRETER